MPEPIRIANGRTCSRPRRGVFMLVFCMVASFNLTLNTPVMADVSGVLAGGEETYRMFSAVHLQEIGLLTLIACLACFSALTMALLLRTGIIARRYKSARRHEADLLRTEIDHLNRLLFSEPQLLVTWTAGQQADIR